MKRTLFFFHKLGVEYFLNRLFFFFGKNWFFQKKTKKKKTRKSIFRENNYFWGEAGVLFIQRIDDFLFHKLDELFSLDSCFRKMVFLKKNHFWGGNYFWEEGSLLFFHLSIFPKKAIFSKKTLRNHFCRAYPFLSGKRHMTTKINITFFIPNYMLNIFSLSYFFKKKKIVFPKKWRKIIFGVAVWLVQKTWVAATRVPRVKAIIYQLHVAQHLWLPQVSLM